MAKQFKYIDTAGKEQTTMADSAESALAGAKNIASNSGVMAVDTMSSQPDPIVNTAVDTVNNYNKRGSSPTLTAESNKASATPPPEPTAPKTDRAFLQDTAKEIAGFDLASERQKAREDAMVSEKEKVQRTEFDALTKLREEKRRRVEEIQTGAGLTKAQKDAIVAQESRVFDRQIADKSFSYNVALGDYQAAEKIANEYISDLQADQTNKQNTWQMLYNLVQNDMTESEKVAAQQAFETKKMQEQFELDKKKATFELGLKKDLASYEAGLKGTGTPDVTKIDGKDYIYDSEQKKFIPAPVAGGVGSDNPVVLAKAQSEIQQVKDLISDSYLNNAVGANRLARLSPMSVVTAGKSNFVANVEQLVSRLSLDALEQAKAEGATFGALDKSEWAILGASATKIQNWREEQLFGNKTEGYKTTPKEMQKELDKINQFASMDYVVKGGNPEDVGLITTDDGNIWYENADGTLTQLVRQ